MIPALGAGGPGFNSQLTPTDFNFFLSSKEDIERQEIRLPDWVDKGKRAHTCAINTRVARKMPNPTHRPKPLNVENFPVT